MYEYTRQTEEELSFPEDAKLDIFDTSDPDWILAGFNGDYGFVPSNYIDQGDGEAPQPEEQEEEEEEPAAPPPPALPARTPSDVASPPLPARNVPSEPTSPAAPTGPAAALASVMTGRSASASHAPPAISLPPRPQYTSEESEEEKSPPLPTRPRGASMQSVEQAYRSPPPDRHVSFDNYVPDSSEASPTHAPKQPPGSFHMYNINEMVSVMGKKKKMPTTLGVNLKTGVILIAPERAQDGPTQEWSADRMTHYSREGKHVFMELVKPSKSVDFHAGAKDTAEEIVSALGELAGAVRAEGLKEVIMAGSGKSQRKGQVLYDFMAQGDDEVTVGVGDEVIILDDMKSEEWWQVRRIKNGKEGVVPSSYIEITGSIASPTTTSHSGINAGKSTVEQNRLEEERLTKEAIKTAQLAEQRERGKRGSEVGPGMRLPDRHSSLSSSARDHSNSGTQQRSKRENGRADGSGSSRSGKSSKFLSQNFSIHQAQSTNATHAEPDPSKVRTWTDRSKSFSVEAQFLGLKDGKINLHKMNGVKIAVPISKMSSEDLEYVERVTGVSLDEDKPLSDLRKKSAQNSSGGSGGKVGASVEPKKPDYDWFQFFLNCDVQPGLCERYSQAFNRDSMDESVLADVDASVLRNLGIREGDIIKVMRFLDTKYARGKKNTGVDEGESGGLFSGPGGTLRNNTRKGRPAPAVQTNDVVDAKAFSQQKETNNEAASPSQATAPSSASAQKSSGGFDDDAWDVKPSKTGTAAPAPASAPAQPPAKPAAPQLTGSMQELSLLSQPLEPTKVQTPVVQTPTVTQPAVTASPPAQVPQPTGATPAFFSGMPAPGANNQMPQAMARQRPIAPQVTAGQGALMPPPPSRPLSAPQSAQPSAFAPPPLQPQMTGNPSMLVQGQVAPPGQSLNDITQARLQQQYAQQMQQQMQQAQQQQQPGPMIAYPTGMQQPGFGQNQFMQQMPNGPQQMQSPFADPRPGQFSPIQAQATGFPGMFNPGGQPQFTGAPTGGINSFLPPALEPQRTGMPAPMQPQPTGMPFTQGFGNAGAPQQPPQPQPQQQQQQAPAPLVPQQTGPPPPVRFGVTGAAKLTAQPTGRRANLSHASKSFRYLFLLR